MIVVIAVIRQTSPKTRTQVLEKSVRVKWKQNVIFDILEPPSQTSIKRGTWDPGSQAL